MRPNLLGIGVHGLALALEIIFDRIPKLAVGDVVTRPGDRRLEPATHLVLPLGPGLEAAHTALDAELDPLVVARLEVQAVKIGGRAPVTTEKRSEEHTSELQSLAYLVCRLLLEKKKKKNKYTT